MVHFVRWEDGHIIIPGKLGPRLSPDLWIYLSFRQSISGSRPLHDSFICRVVSQIRAEGSAGNPWQITDYLAPGHHTEYNHHLLDAQINPNVTSSSPHFVAKGILSGHVGTRLINGVTIHYREFIGINCLKFATNLSREGDKFEFGYNFGWKYYSVSLQFSIMITVTYNFWEIWCIFHQNYLF